MRLLGGPHELEILSLQTIAPACSGFPASGARAEMNKREKGGSSIELPPFSVAHLT